MIRLIAIDIDGTLTAQPREVSPRNIAAIRHAAQEGVFVTLATGRSYEASRPILAQLQISGACIVFGGAVTVDAGTGETLLAKYLLPETVHDALEAAKALGVHAQIYRGSTVITERDCAAFQKYCDYIGLPRRIDPSIRSVVQQEAPKILVIVPPEDDARVQAQMEAALGGRVRVTRSQPGFVEINDPAATKANALRDLSGKLCIARDEVCAIGDSYLDIDMIEWAGLGACMENGVPEARAAADRILPACEDDGVAALIEALLQAQGAPARVRE